MIEALVDYIVKKGFQVKVFEGRLIIFKEVDQQLCEYGWAPGPFALLRCPKDILFDQADYFMYCIDQEIARGIPVSEKAV
jgi:hypothetical protein